MPKITWKWKQWTSRKPNIELLHKKGQLYLKALEVIIPMCLTWMWAWKAEVDPSRSRIDPSWVNCAYLPSLKRRQFKTGLGSRQIFWRLRLLTFFSNRLRLQLLTFFPSGSGSEYFFSSGSGSGSGSGSPALIQTFFLNFFQSKI